MLAHVPEAGIAGIMGIAGIAGIAGIRGTNRNYAGQKEAKGNGSSGNSLLQRQSSNQQDLGLLEGGLDGDRRAVEAPDCACAPFRCGLSMCTTLQVWPLCVHPSGVYTLTPQPVYIMSPAALMKG